MMYKLLTIGLFLALLSPGVLAQQYYLKVASYNLRYDNPGDSLNSWKYRKETVAKLIRFHDFDIFGTQEVLSNQLEELSAALQDYAYIGVGREDGKSAGEFSAIFYKKDKFKLINEGTFWLSENTNRPNKGWDAVLPRICSWGEFEEQESGLRFYLFNTHFDHVGVQARKESARLILRKINEIAANTAVILTGDFNVDQTSESYQVINASERLTDSYELSPLRYGASGTFNGFNINASTESRIDHIFLTDHFQVLRHGILTDSYQSAETNSIKENSGNFPKEVSLYKNQSRLPSDHYPILLEVTYTSKK